MLVLLIFYFFLGLVALSALGMLLSNNILYIAFLLMSTLLGMAALFVFCGADFLAIVQLLVYVGGILVLLLFGIMLGNSSKPNLQASLEHQAPRSTNKNIWLGLLVSGGLFTLLAWTILKANFTQMPWIQQSMTSSPPLKETSVPTLGVGLMTDYLVTFEVAGLLLLMALIGASFIAFQKNDTSSS